MLNMKKNTDNVFAWKQIEKVRRQKVTKMPKWLKNNREAYAARIKMMAVESFENTGIWFLARGASRNKDEQETAAVWGDLLNFYDLKDLPGYSRENHQQAVRFWQSWQNLDTGRLYNPLYQDPQHPEVKRQIPGNRDDYSPDKINLKYIPNILSILGAELPLPVNIEAYAENGTDTFDQLWKEMAQWNASHAGMFPVNAAYELEAGNLEKIPQVEAGMSALVRTCSEKTGMWRPEHLKDFPWKDYLPSSGFKILSRICGYAGMENYPEKLIRTAVDNLLQHKAELYSDPAMARNYGEMLAHYLMLSDYRNAEILNAMEECLNGFRNTKLWKKTGWASYCLFGSSLIGAFMNWEDLPLKTALLKPSQFRHGSEMKWRFVLGPYENWINVIPKEAYAIYGHPDYDYEKYSLKTRNKVHWSKKITELIPLKNIPLKLDSSCKKGEGIFSFKLTEKQLDKYGNLYLKAVWNGAYDVSINGIPIKLVRYNMPELPAGWYIPEAAVKIIQAGENTIQIGLIGPGKDQKTGAPLSEAKPFIDLGLIDWS